METSKSTDVAQQWLEGRVTQNRAWGPHLHSLRVEADLGDFQAGQFTKLGLEIDGEVIGRPYSLVNSPEQRPLDFYFGVVPDGPLSGRLADLQPGDAVLVAPKPAGFLTLSELPDARDLWLIASGTGIGPFLSILRTDEPWRRFERAVLVHAVRTAAELAYRETIAEIGAAHPGRFAGVPFVSREATDFALAGRVPQAIADGRLEARAGAMLAAGDSQVMICGNPKMVDDVTAALVARGMKKHRRKEPGQISVENYW
jgi:ferredoxin--NADP+ reductase